MAISELDSGGTGYVQSNVSTPVIVAQGAGDRRLVVVCCSESGSDNGVDDITLDGIDLTLVSDGVTDADNEQGGFARVQVFDLRQSEMPADGSKDLDITWATPGDDHFCFFWLLDGAKQSVDFDDVLAIGDGTTGTTLSGSIDAATSDSALLIGAYKNNADTSLTITAPASTTVEDSVDATGGGAELLAASKFGGLSVGANTVTQVGDSSNRHVLVAVVIEPATLTQIHESNVLVNDEILLSGDFLENRRPVAGDYFLRTLCDCNKLVRLDLQLWVGGSVQSEETVQVQPNTDDPFDIPFTTITEPTDVRLKIDQVVGGNSQIELTIDVQLFNSAGEVP